MWYRQMTGDDWDRESHSYNIASKRWRRLAGSKRAADARHQVASPLFTNALRVSNEWIAMNLPRLRNIAVSAVVVRGHYAERTISADLKPCGSDVDDVDCAAESGGDDDYEREEVTYVSLHRTVRKPKYVERAALGRHSP
mmetsp:Transcript_20342/g.62900  ORF Transcript_20342/g.62900 Transcript_20342/m.62900 type:complete len:140 (+) Transcript_20342:127-546(+)